MPTEIDRRYLAAAIRLGQRHLGRTAPNPAVGCLIVADGRVVGAGATGQGGRPHGETLALDAASGSARGATAYVSLEPCDHVGKTGPCTHALIASGIARVVIALGDPDPRVSGAGIARLREAGLTVDSEPFADMRAMAARAHAGHITRVAKGRPHVTLKLALSADGAIGLRGQGQVAITGPRTNALMHGLRSRVDAIAVGAGTFRADAPQLTVRLPGLGHRSPRRVVLGGAPPDDASILHCPGHDLAASLKGLGAAGVTTLLVEGGAAVARALLEAHLVDELVLLRGGTLLGEAAMRVFPADPFAEPEGAGLGGWSVRIRRNIGQDVMHVLAPPV